MQNCGHSCAALQILILPDGWDQADLLLDDLRGLLRTLEPRAPYYPGSDARVARALADQEHVEALGPDGGRFPVTVDDPGHACSLFRDEVFADVLGVVQLPAPDVESALAHLPSSRFTANAAWLVAATIAFNLTRAIGVTAGGKFARAEGATLRARIINTPARISRSGRRQRLHLPERWPWATHWQALWTASFST